LYHNKGEPGGPSAKETQQMVRKRFDGTGPSDRTIVRYINENKLVGASPVKPGSPGDIPPACFDSLCVGVESYISIMQLNRRCGNNIGKMELAQLVNGVVDSELLWLLRRLLGWPRRLLGTLRASRVKKLNLTNFRTVQ
jgi:hypothetical protein